MAHQSEIKKQGKEHSNWYLNNKEAVEDIKQQISLWYKNRRASCDFTKLIEVIHDSCLCDLLNGNILCTDIIKTKCPICGKFDDHPLHSIWSYTKNDFSCDSLPMCSSCRRDLVVSKYEQEVADYISTFYAGELIKNDRIVLNGKELDLYYPEKKIAIEFNGDYWHDENHKSADYHKNKYISCKLVGITLVSIFETYWSTEKDSICTYLKDLFADKINSLSLNECHTYMNNNYPSPLLDVDDSIVPHYYVNDNNAKVYTCGFSKLSEG